MLTNILTINTAIEVIKMAKVESNIGRNGPSFIIEMGGEHDVTMRQVVVSADFSEGDIIESPSSAVSATSDSVMGIVTKDCVSGDTVSVLSNGQPTTVDGYKLAYGDADEGTVNDLLRAMQIVVVKL
ncbi:hypothetical protein [Halomonas sp. BN3-1]|uniref:hypothetical protein n=1 Tax=Halomonas sp. BN3-1 TaxID=2082393 RepID=UPI0013B41B4C|nr:hypothetical protein [Halomonas sp. BN3-1]